MTIKHHVSCNAVYPEKPANEMGKAMQVIDLGDGKYIAQCADCGAHESLAEVKRCTIDEIGLEITGEDAPPIIKQINKYLHAFASPIKKPGEPGMMTGSKLCIGCGLQLDGVLGTFTWGITNGAGFCSNCGWPCHAYHRPKDSEGERIFTSDLQVVLQYHPGEISSGNLHKDQE